MPCRAGAASADTRVVQRSLRRLYIATIPCVRVFVRPSVGINRYQFSIVAQTAAWHRFNFCAETRVTRNAVDISNVKSISDRQTDCNLDCKVLMTGATDTYYCLGRTWSSTFLTVVISLHFVDYSSKRARSKAETIKPKIKHQKII